ncbi:MAG: DUF433 domain-containing protein [Silvibacterium sp.]
MNIDWQGCDLVEQVPGKMSGRPVAQGTRILADTIVEDAELGESVDAIHENYPSPSADTIRMLLAFVQSRKPSFPIDLEH